MTTIKKLRLNGFKSFPKLTEIPFGPGFSCVLGTNGSGKSNIADSITFVLGTLSAKTLRAERTSNLIYNGGKRGSPMRQAQVDIIFDNEKKEFPIDDKEVKISRIVRHSGNSVYKINNETRTRQQVLELLSTAGIDPGGHNIIVQGDVAKFIDMRPEERREIIEEIAGLSVYEEKKDKSLRELDKVESKLKEADIVLTERKTHLKEIRKDRDQALKYKELEKKILRNKATHIHLQIKQKEKSKENIEKKLNDHSNSVKSLQGKLDRYKQEISKLQDEISNVQREMEEKGEKGQRELQDNIENLKEFLVKKESRRDVLENEIQKIGQRKKQLKQNILELDNKIGELKKRLTDVEKSKVELIVEEEDIVKRLESFRKNHPGLRGDREKNIEGLQRKIFQDQNELNNLLREHDRVSFRSDELAERIEAIGSMEGTNLRREFQDVVGRLNKFIDKDSKLTHDIHEERKKINEYSEQLAKLQTRSVALHERPNARVIQKVLGSGISGIYNTVSELARVKEKYSLAIEISAGGRADSIVVENDQVAAKCIKFLKDNRLGVLRFMPLNKIKPYPVNSGIQKLTSLPGVHGLAVDLVKYDSRFFNVFSSVFGSTLVVDSIETSRKVGIGRSRMVTLGGDLIEAGGAMIGGFRRKRTALFKHVDLDSKTNEFETMLTESRKIVDGLEKEKLELESHIQKTREQKHELEGDLVKQEKLGEGSSLVELTKEKKSQDKRLTSIIKEIKNIEARISSSEKSLQRLQSEKQKVVPGSIQSLEKKHNEIKDNILQCDSEIKSIQLQITDIYGKEQTRSEDIIRVQEKERKEFEEELVLLKKGLKDGTVELKEKDQRYRQFSKRFQSLFSKRDKLQAVIQKKEKGLVRIEEQIRAAEDKKNTVGLDKAKIIAELSGLGKEYEDFSNVEIRKNVTLEETKYDLQRCEKQISGLGNVNLRSLEIYEQLEKDYEQLVEKADKLGLEKQDVLGMIDEIEQKKGSLFMKTYDEITKNFSKIYSQLSMKGDAYIDLEDKENPFNGGLIVKVKLTAGKVFDIKSLSGGEKTMTALAFIFAVQEYNPASFYLLDEVDAALDKTNSQKLSELISQYSGKAQYIVISHNDAVISEAKQIYGVSMQQGISKVVSLKV